MRWLSDNVHVQINCELCWKPPTPPSSPPPRRLTCYSPMPCCHLMWRTPWWLPWPWPLHLQKTCLKVLKSKFCFTYRIQFRLVIHLELIGFRLITGLANLHVGVSSEAPCVIHQAMSSLPLSSLNLQLWKPNILESPTWNQFTKSTLQHLVALFQMQLWNYEPWNSLFNPNKSILYVSL